VGDLSNSDFIMNNTLWLGVYPGLTEEMLSYVVDSIHEFVAKVANKNSARSKAQ
jgi:CDP-6-deoxy-D-xylo-4-hexulose-3-dehydrase